MLSGWSHCANDEPRATGPQRDRRNAFHSNGSAKSWPAQVCAARLVHLEAAFGLRRFLHWNDIRSGFGGSGI